MSKRRFKFLGYGEQKPFFGDGAFTVGELYRASFVGVEDAEFLDDCGEKMWEELQYFEELPPATEPESRDERSD